MMAVQTWTRYSKRLHEAPNSLSQLSKISRDGKPPPQMLRKVGSTYTTPPGSSEAWDSLPAYSLLEDKDGAKNVKRKQLQWIFEEPSNNQIEKRTHRSPSPKNPNPRSKKEGPITQKKKTIEQPFDDLPIVEPVTFTQFLIIFSFWAMILIFWVS